MTLGADVFRAGDFEGVTKEVDDGGAGAIEKVAKTAGIVGVGLEVGFGVGVGGFGFCGGGEQGQGAEE